jgi:protein-S-isoprenylcysteine O-methyltransferase Ste14
MTMTGVGPIILSIMGVYAAAALAVHYAFYGLFAVRAIPSVCLVVAGCLLTGIGVPLCVQSVRTVRRAFRKGRLVTEGVFSVCRHPVYASALVCMTGVTLFFRSWLLLTVPVVGYLAARIFVREEDAYLEEKFGQEFLDYKRRVNPLFPTFRR